MTLSPFFMEVAAANLKRGGWDEDTRFHDHEKLEAMLSPLNKSPHVLFLSECTNYEMFRRRPLFDVLELLNTLWGSGPRYREFISEVPGSVNVPGLFVDTRYVRPVEWYDATKRTVNANTLEARINGQLLRLKSVHWNGSHGEYGFYQQADREGQLAQKAVVQGGDYNATSSEPGEHYPVDWEARCVDADERWKLSQKGVYTLDGWKTNLLAIDRFLAHGWTDMGAEARDFTPTAAGGMRIDRIMVSDKAPVKLVPGTYRVHKPIPGRRLLSDHNMVSCTLEVAPATP